MPKIKFAKQDIDTMHSAVKLIQDKRVKDNLINLSNKINNDILYEKNENTKLIANDKELGIYNTISKALKYNFKLKIKYYNLQHGKTIRTIYPLGLYLFQEEWWCSSYWEEKDDTRQFHLKRIIEAEIMKEKFDPKKINIKF